jgi:hypothetical protein
VKDKLRSWLKDINDAGTGAVVSGLIVASIGVAVTVMMAGGHAAPAPYEAARLSPVSAGVRPLRPPLHIYRAHPSAAKRPRHKPSPAFHTHAIVRAVPPPPAHNAESPLESMISRLRASGFSGIPGPGYTGWRWATVHNGTPAWGPNLFRP